MKSTVSVNPSAGVQALTDVSFAVAAGEIVGLIGPNGAGKTTCFNLINGLLPPSAGGIRLGGADMVGLPPYRRARLGLARTFQNIQLFGGMTVLENVLTGYHLHQQVGVLAALLPLPMVRRAQAENRRRALELLELVGLGGRRTSPPRPWPTATSGAWKSPGPWPNNRSSCSWTSPPPASTPGRPRTSWP